MGYGRREQVVAKEDIITQESDTSSDVSHDELGSSCNYTIRDTSNSQIGKIQGGCRTVGI